MRLKITLSTQSIPVSIPVNYNHFIYAELRDKIKRHSDAFKSDKRLKDLGIFKDRFRIYTFSFLRFKSFLIESEEIKLTSQDEFNFFISSPFNSFIEGIAVAFLRDGNLKIGDVNFTVKSIIKINLPKFNSEMKLRLLSPIAVVKSPAEKRTFLTPEEPGYFDKIKEDLIRKYNFLYGEKIKDIDFEMRFDSEYINSRGGRFSKLIKFGRMNIKCFLAPFTIKTDPRLIEVGYEWGFGHKNHFGFGMAVISEQ
ncbi:CRISPR-associated endoribonuclease Cas6 [Candidatus Kryptobacter tengchongensis]|uniref:CRISPR-associated endoribonuclease Cas6 n=1 Tax=Kryptobacter tengchongensis TaxID=1643429 RepID=UPI000707A433|nr:CRISPR-associated endoribonuclease Cas6 [Candidatus Kryptobacter tengchongensis]CUS79376.1 CRISPR-associated endoribonuclease Cas6 [Candidatus Kryptobacter tengchongensis]